MNPRDQGMRAADDDEVTVRLAIYRHFARTGGAPTTADLADQTGLASGAVTAALEQLDAQRAIVLTPGTRYLWMAMPFSAVPTAFRVSWAGASAFANCAWDALGIPAMLGTDAEIATTCPVTGLPLSLSVAGGAVHPADAVVHFAVPAAEWWNDIGFT